jgi:hypothetical protein
VWMAVDCAARAGPPPHRWLMAKARFSPATCNLACFTISLTLPKLTCRRWGWVGGSAWPGVWGSRERVHVVCVCAHVGGFLCVWWRKGSSATHLDEVEHESALHEEQGHHDVILLELALLHLNVGVEHHRGVVGE